MTPAAAVEVSLTPSKDNTLYQSASGSLSNGAGIYLFSGRTNQGSTLYLRRALMRFDVAGSVPAGATIDSVTLTMEVTRVANFGAVNGNFSLHRVSADWGEGASNDTGQQGNGTSAATGDATWLHRFFNSTFWSSAGGDFLGTVSGSTFVTGLGNYTWTSTAQMVSDVQGWLDSQGTNFGWILLGSETANKTARRFASRENANAPQRPTLTINYTASLPQVDFSASSYSVTEGQGSKLITVTLDKAPGPGNTAAVAYATVNGTAAAGADYTFASGTLNFGAADTLKTFSVPITDDGTIENDEMLTLVLSAPAGCTLANVNNPAALTIVSNDIPGALVYVDFSNMAGESGMIGDPYNTLAEGIVAVTSGGTIRIAAGTSSETPAISVAMRLEATGGTVRIGGTVQSKAGAAASNGSETIEMGALLKVLYAALVPGDSAQTDAEKDLGSADGVHEPVLPRGLLEDGTYAASPGQVLAVRLRGGAAIDPASIWGPVTSSAGGVRVGWRPVSEGDERDIWVLFSADEGWYLNDLVTVGAEALTVEGEVVSSGAYDFAIGAADASEGGAAVWQPEADTEVSVTAEGADAVAGPFVLGPDQVYETPQRVWLPLPEGVAPGAVRLYYYHPNGPVRGWYPAEAVAGWLVPDSYQRLDLEGSTYLGFLVRHAGTVRLVAEK